MLVVVGSMLFYALMFLNIVRLEKKANQSVKDVLEQTMKDTGLAFRNYKPYQWQ
jgi:hypothetical protein